VVVLAARAAAAELLLATLKRRIGKRSAEPLVHVLLIVMVTALCALSPTRANAQSQADEYQLKAAYLFHFAQFVDWPPEALKNSGNTFLICILGDDPFHGDLGRIMQGKLVGEQTVRVQNIKQMQEAQGCHVLFIDKNESKRKSLSLAELRTLPVLTVGESEDFLNQGGIIRFFLEDRKIRFDINQQAAGNANLKVSSRLLLLAKTVLGEGIGK
jgi:hypothetical protein